MPGGETVPNYKAVNETNCSNYRGTPMFKNNIQHTNTQYLIHLLANASINTSYSDAPPYVSATTNHLQGNHLSRYKFIINAVQDVHFFLSFLF